MASGRLMVLFFLLAVTTAALADEPLPVTADVNLLVSTRYQLVRDGLVNPDNVLRQGDARAEAATVLEGQVLAAGYRFRLPYATERITTPTKSDWTSAHKLVLQEFSRDFDLTEEDSLTLGKTNLRWDNGFSFHPLGFFDKNVDLSDPDDRMRRSEGLPMIALKHSTRNWDGALVIAKDFGEKRDGLNKGLTQWAGKWGTQIGAVTFAAVAQQPVGERIGGGFSGTSVFGNNLELHGSIFARQGTRRPTHRALLSGEIRYYRDDEDAVGEFRRKEGEWYPRWLIGGQWTSEALVNIILEWYHDSQGLNREQWGRLRDLVRFHRQTSPGIIPETAVTGNLRNDAKLFLSDTVRQDYLFFRLVKSIGAWENSLNTLVGVADGGASVNIRFLYNGAQTWQFWLDGRINVGPSGSEFRSVPQDRYVGTVLRYIF